MFTVCVYGNGKWQPVEFRTMEDAQEFMETLEDNGYSCRPGANVPRRERPAGVL